MLESKPVKLFFSRSFLAISALLVLSLFALKDLAKPGAYTSHDGETHTATMAQYWQALADGQIPPRFAGSLYNGLGSPILTYIYPLPYLAGSAVHALGFSFTDSFEIIMGLGFILSGIFSYLWLKELTASEKAAFLGALFYTWAPYRFLLIYVRGSISENTAYTFLPLVFYSLTRLQKNLNLSATALVALAMSLLALSQNLVAVIFLPVIAIYVLLLALHTKSLKYLTQAVVAGLWGLAITAITYLPAIFERNFIRFNEVYSLTYLDHFVSLKQLLYSPWGYGFSLLGTGDLMSFQIGLAHLLVLLIFPSILIFKITRLKIDRNLTLTLAAVLTVALAVILMINNKFAILFWQYFEPKIRIDYPWRLLGITTFAASLVAAYVVKTAKPGLVFLFLAVAVLVANRNHLRINLPQQFDDKFFLEYANTATQVGEFTPKWRQSTGVPVGFDINIPVQLAQGDASFKNVIAKSNEVIFKADVLQDQAQVRINKFYFPGWNVEVDGMKLTPFDDLIITDTKARPLGQEQDASGLMIVSLGRGEHQVKARFGQTKLRLFADFLSLGAFLTALAIVTKNLHAKK